MDIGTQVATALRWSTAGRLAAQILTWAVTLFVIRLLSPQDYGLMALAMVLMEFSFLLNELGLGSAIVQRRDFDRAMAAQILAIVLLVNGVLFVAVYLAAPLVADFYDQPALTTLIRVLALSLPIAALSVVPLNVLRREMRFKAKSLVDFSAAICASLTTLALALAGLGVWALAIGHLAGRVCTAGMALVMSRYWVWPRLSRTLHAEVFRFGGLILLNRLLFFAYNQADTLIAGRLLGAGPLGLYTVAKTLSAMPLAKVSGIVNEIGFAAFSKVKDDADAVSRHMSRVLRTTGLLAFPVGIGLACVTPELVWLLLGERWLEVTRPLQIMSLAIPLRMLANVLSPAIYAIGRPGLMARYLALSCVAMPTAFALGAGHGLTGMALAWITVYPLLFGVLLRMALPVLGLGLNEFWRAIKTPCLVGIGMGAGVLGLRGILLWAGLDTWLVATLCVLAGVLLYGVGTWVSGRNHLAELRVLLGGR